MTDRATWEIREESIKAEPGPLINGEYDTYPQVAFRTCKISCRDIDGRRAHLRDHSGEPSAGQPRPRAELRSRSVTATTRAMRAESEFLFRCYSDPVMGRWHLPICAKDGVHPDHSVRPREGAAAAVRSDCRVAARPLGTLAPISSLPCRNWPH
jgi:hypothetical protein